MSGETEREHRVKLAELERQLSSQEDLVGMYHLTRRSTYLMEIVVDMVT